jgi:hypothetical protein
VVRCHKWQNIKTSNEGAVWSDITPNIPADTLLSGLTMDSSPQHVLYANGNGGIWAYSTKPLDITVEMIAPYTATVGGPSLTLAVTGNGFGSDAVVLWNGSTLATTYISPSQLMAAVPANLITAAGFIDISVSSEANTSANFGFAIGPLRATAGPVVTTTAITQEQPLLPVGILSGVQECLYAITVERRIKHPTVAAICDAAENWFKPVQPGFQRISANRRSS